MDSQAKINYAEARLERLSIVVMDHGYGADFTFNEAFSLMVLCENQAETDNYWEQLSFVPEAEQCGWIKDRFGVSWQITPANMNEMDHAMMAKCGTYCGTCSWKEPCNCGGCEACQGQLFWGTCDKAICCIERGYAHCGICPDMPCHKLIDLFNDPEHGDDGARIRNLKNWAQEIYTFEKLR